MTSEKVIVARECRLGTITPTFQQVRQGMLPRQHFQADFEPSKTCIDLMQEVSLRVEGLGKQAIEAVIPNPAEGSAFALVIGRDIDIWEVVANWLDLLEEELARRTPEELLELTGGIVPFDPTPAVAVNSVKGSWRERNVIGDN